MLPHLPGDLCEAQFITLSEVLLDPPREGARDEGRIIIILMGGEEGWRFSGSMKGIKEGYREGH